MIKAQLVLSGAKPFRQIRGDADGGQFPEVRTVNNAQ